ncbi:hypothetical protein K437DRAFT_53918 [Tilletiaria anomala UBC 951]|uniref:Uncharacterized protein n=1 Tax=Tilletiaria anomala (strain ATCC 24038 / CBS 436.72 / UBC 951) TaxID=1037660 RepID=A0A066V899_TILAU|nr:uncharacterized protein K437DRAFT_53918 [Tilletiaria anomala UBC 951]KDN36513.1 hypothetical protein K437DRAFT_53918 [Tilletiaria anomala UBC 951]
MSLRGRAEAGAAAAAATTVDAATSSVVPAVLAVIGVVSLITSIAFGAFVYIRVCKPELAAKLRMNRVRGKDESAKSKGIMIGEPQLKFAPQHVDNAIDLGKTSVEQRTALSRRHLEKHNGMSNELAARAAAMWDMPSSTSNETNSSGPAPATSSESEIGDGSKEADEIRRPKAARLSSGKGSMRITSAEHSTVARTERRANRVAVPSQLLRSLGELPSVPDLADTTTNSSASESSLDSVPRLAPVVGHHTLDLEEGGSLTPILNLNFDLEPATTRTTMRIEDDLDFEIQRSAWLTNTLSTAFDCVKSSPPNSGFIAETDHNGPSTMSLVPVSRKQSIKDARPSIESKRSNNTYASSRARSGSVSTKLTGGGDTVYQSASSLASARFSVDSYAPPIPSIPSHMHVAINMPEKLDGLDRRSSQVRKSLGKPIDVPVKEVDESDEALPNLAFRPLSLGLSLSSSSNSSIGAALFRNARRSFWDSNNNVVEDPESGISSGISSGSSSGRGELESSRSRYSTEEVSSQSSRTSSRVFAPGADAPPVPSLPSHVSSDPKLSSGNSQRTAGTASHPGDSSVPSVMVSDDSMTVDDNSYETQSTSFDISALREVSPVVPSKEWKAAATPSSPIDKPLPTIREHVLDAHRSVALDATNFLASSPPAAAIAKEQSIRSEAEQRRENLLSQLAPDPRDLSRRPSFADNIRARFSRHSPALPSSPGTESPSWAREVLSKEKACNVERPDTMSTISTSFGAPATEQWRVSTDDDEMPMFLPKDRIPGTKDAIGLGLSGGDEINERSRDDAVTTAVMGRVLQAREAADRAISESPIMQSGKWATGRKQQQERCQTASTAADEDADIDFGALNTSITVGSSESSPLEEFQRTLSHLPSRPSSTAPQYPTREQAQAQPSKAPVLSPDMNRSSPRFGAASAFSPSRPSRASAYSLASPRTDADTMSIASSCLTETMGEGHDQAIDRRAKLLQSVQQSLAARTKREDTFGRFMLRDSTVPRSPSSFLRNKQDATSSPVKKPSDLVLRPSNILPPHILSPLTPPETPANPSPSPTESVHTIKPPLAAASSSSSTGQRSPLAQPLSSSESQGSMSSAASDVTESFRSPAQTALKAPKLRPLSLTANSSILDDPSLLPSPTSRHHAPGAASPAGSATSSGASNIKSRTRQMYEERRQSRAGGILPVHAVDTSPGASFAKRAATFAGAGFPSHFAAATATAAISEGIASPQIGQAT